MNNDDNLSKIIITSYQNKSNRTLQILQANKYYLLLTSKQMGNITNYHKDLNVFIETQKPYYNSGSSIQGTVFVQVKQNCVFNALYLRIQGNQKCKWFEGSSKNRRKLIGDQKFYIVEHILHKFQSNFLQKGKYAYPFSIELSDNIPGSFQSPQHNASINYNLIVYFANYNDQGSAIQFQKQIMIRQPFRQDVVKYIGEVESEEHSLGGHVKVVAEIDRNVAYEGQDIQLSINVNNKHGKFDVKHIKLELIQYSFVSSNANACRTYHKTVLKDNKKEVIRKGEVKQIDLTFRMPQVPFQSSISTLVANYYRLEITVDCGLPAINLSIYAPIFVLKPALQVKGENLKSNHNEQGWNYQKVVCIRSGEYFFKKNRNLQIVNFKTQDLIAQSVYGHESPFH